MSLLILSKRHQDIIVQSSNLNFKLNLLNQKRMDLQSYASSISNSPLSVYDLMNVPSSMFNKMSIFMQNADQSARAYVGQNLEQVVAANRAQAPQSQDLQAQEGFRNMIAQKLYQNMQDAWTKQETDILNREEKKIEQQIAQIETQVKMLDSEEKTVSEAEGKEAEKAAPKFA